jgi:hypothetical protein
MALDALRTSDAASKHAIIISDGDPSPPTPELVQGYIDAKITASMVAINPHGGRDVSVMRTIAEATGGRYYLPDDPSQLPSIFIKEAKTLKRSMVQNVVFQPQIDFPSNILRGIDALPLLRGFVLTTPKPRANVVLRAPPQVADDAGEIDPILATWRFGLGSAAAWTSDLAPNWAVDWIPWEKYRAFVAQLVTEISRVERKSDLQMQTFASGSEGIIAVEDFAPKNAFLDLSAKVTGPRGETITVPLRQIDARRYHATFPLWGKGRYQVLAAGIGQLDGVERSEQAVAGFVVPYSPEYLRFRSDPILLKQIANGTGGRVLTAADTDLFHPPRAARESSRPVFDWFLVALAILLPLDVAVRRVQLDWAVMRGWFQRPGVPSGEMMGALLERKKRAREALAARRAEGRPPAIARANQTTPAVKANARSEAEPPPEPAAHSTTEQLLARKRRRQERDNPRRQP